ncbi:hypothetical protein EI94DRAFT_1802930 [Lactarius quietus]|nr:hypothetical protein EI94DRAFT_1802930 [Lactarius quietus]
MPSMRESPSPTPNRPLVCELFRGPSTRANTCADEIISIKRSTSQPTPSRKSIGYAMHASLVATLVLAASVVGPALSTPLAIRGTSDTGVVARDTSPLPARYMLDFPPDLLINPDGPNHGHS